MLESPKTQEGTTAAGSELPPLPVEPYASEDLPPDFWDSEPVHVATASPEPPAPASQNMGEVVQDTQDARFAELQSLFPGRILSVEALSEDDETPEAEAAEDDT